MTFNQATGALGGMPATGTAGTYPLTFTADNGIGTAATQNFTLTIDQHPPETPPAITSSNNASFIAGTTGTFTVTTTGNPTPVLSVGGTLPAGVHFVDNGDTTGTFTGMPAAGTGGAYTLTVNANNGIGTPASQGFTLTVNQAPAITSANTASFLVGSAGTYQLTTTGFPAPTLSESGPLPDGVTFDPATGILGGKPSAGTAGTYNLSFTASNQVGANASLGVTLTVNQQPAITSGGSATFTTGKADSFNVTATGSPIPTLSESGALPLGRDVRPGDRDPWRYSRGGFRGQL